MLSEMADLYKNINEIKEILDKIATSNEEIKKEVDDFMVNVLAIESSFAILQDHLKTIENINDISTIDKSQKFSIKIRMKKIYAKLGCLSESIDILDNQHDFFEIMSILEKMLGMVEKIYACFPVKEKTISPYFLFEKNRSREKFARDKYLKISNSLWSELKEKHPESYEELMGIFATIKEYEGFPGVKEAIETGVLSLKNKVFKSKILEETSFIGQNTLQNLMEENDFLRNFIYTLCEKVSNIVDKVFLGIKLHRRDIPAKGAGLRGLGAHHDYDADSILMIKVKQVNITGGENQLVEKDMKKQHEVTYEICNIPLTENNIPDPGDALLLRNYHYRHQVCAMKLTDPNYEGYRDAIIIEVNPLICPIHQPFVRPPTK